VEHPKALVVAHPECPLDVLAMADFIGSTSAIIQYCVSSPAEEFIVMTESGVNHSLTKLAPGKQFYYVQNENCNCSECPYMKRNTLEKLRDCLRDLQPRVEIEPDILQRAALPIERMPRAQITMLVDSFARQHTNLRISVTDRCNIRCYYCMPEDVRFGAREEILSFEELERVVRVAASMGVDKIRITGGEPLVRKDLPRLIEKILEIDGIVDVALTTNAVLLARQAKDLYNAGLRRLNVHLDTLSPELFERITRRNEFHRVMEGIECSLALGFKVKVNAVALKGVNEGDIVPLARFGRERGIEIRYI
jgi:uncharacterized radical SAM superfamily Fe-S cluster-containing enzyme